ncbi:MAG: response regulator transcription factor, partial [Candidatus Accumulibacter sp.]|nr:response regulator transcription factor [Accumulibacter sp.]
MRVVLADDHCLVRAGIRSLLGGFAGVEVVGEADDGRGAVGCVGDCLPDVLLIDIAMKDMNGLLAAAEIRRLYPHVRVVVLSMHADPEYVLQALQAGAAGYLIKDAAPVELDLALHAVMRGETWLSPRVSR